jgi:hypothetical protein
MELVVVRAAGEVPGAEGEVEGSEGEGGGVVASKGGLDGSLEQDTGRCAEILVLSPKLPYVSP